MAHFHDIEGLAVAFGGYTGTGSGYDGDRLFREKSFEEQGIGDDTDVGTDSD